MKSDFGNFQFCTFYGQKASEICLCHFCVKKCRKLKNFLNFYNKRPAKHIAGQHLNRFESRLKCTHRLEHLWWLTLCLPSLTVDEWGISRLQTYAWDFSFEVEGWWTSTCPNLEYRVLKLKSIKRSRQTAGFFLFLLRGPESNRGLEVMSLPRYHSSTPLFSGWNYTLFT